jgi:hypothetical protein
MVTGSKGDQVMKSILDRSFKYIPSHETDVRRTFERARQQQQADRDAAPANKVLSLPGRSARASGSAA